MARTNWVSETQATRPEQSTRSRAARGASRTSQAQIRSPSARKKYVENSTMKKPARTWPTAVPTSVTWPTTPPSWCCSVIASWACAIQSLIWESLALSGPSCSQSADLVEALDHLVGEVVGAVGDLLADEGEQQRDEREAAEHDQAGAPARAGAPTRRSRRTSGPDERRDEQRDDQRAG